MACGGGHLEGVGGARIRQGMTERYENHSGGSGVVSYEIQDGAIVVCFAGGACYLYDAERPGVEQVAEMQRLAVDGAGLATYISQQVRERYARRVC